MHLKGTCATFNSLRTCSRESVDKANSKLQVALSAGSDGTNINLSSQNRLIGVKDIRHGKNDSGRNRSNYRLARICHVFVKLAESLRKSTADTFYDMFVQGAQNLWSFLTSYSDVNIFKPFLLEWELDRPPALKLKNEVLHE